MPAHDQLATLLVTRIADQAVPRLNVCSLSVLFYVFLLVFLQNTDKLQTKYRVHAPAWSYWCLVVWIVYDSRLGTRS